LGVDLSQLSGINPDERVVCTLGCSYQKFTGELVLTNKGVVFLRATGMFKTGSERLHYFGFDDLEGIRVEKKGLFGACIAIDQRSLAWGNRTYRYSCSESNAQQFLDAVENQKLQLKTPDEIDSVILSLVKPKGEADLRQVAKNGKVRSLIARLYSIDPSKLPDIEALNIVRDIVVSLISKGNLDGIITDENKYISNVMLSRKTVQYQVVLDFHSIYSQLENKGIVLQTLECPSCNGKLEYPKEGDTVVCQFCGATVHAVDVFKKFKDLL
jgi:hypothetical protein